MKCSFAKSAPVSAPARSTGSPDSGETGGQMRSAMSLNA